jgi:hypothetical protein
MVNLEGTLKPGGLFVKIGGLRNTKNGHFNPVMNYARTHSVSSRNFFVIKEKNA